MWSRSSTEADEAVLCMLKVDCNGVLSVKPDFNKGRRAYKVGGGLNGRGMIHSLLLRLGECCE